MSAIPSGTGCSLASTMNVSVPTVQSQWKMYGHWMKTNVTNIANAETMNMYDTPDFFGYSSLSVKNAEFGAYFEYDPDVSQVVTTTGSRNTTGTWHHICAIYPPNAASSTLFELYIDGVQQASVSDTGNTNSGTMEGVELIDDTANWTGAKWADAFVATVADRTAALALIAELQTTAPDIATSTMTLRFYASLEFDAHCQFGATAGMMTTTGTITYSESDMPAIARKPIRYAGRVGNSGNGTSGASNANITTTVNVPAGDLLVLVGAMDNTGTSDTASGTELSAVSGGSVGTWARAGERVNAGTGAAAGVTQPTWWLQPTGTLTSGSTISLTFTTRTDKCFEIFRFHIDGAYSGYTFSLTAADDAEASNTGFGGPTLSGLSSVERLYIGSYGKESTGVSPPALTPTTNFLNTGTTKASRSNASAVNLRAEYRINTSTGETSAATLATGDAAAWLFAFDLTAPGGGVFDVEFDVNSAGLVAFLKEIQKRPTITAGKSVTVSKAMTKTVPVSSSGVVSAIKSVAKSIALTGSSAATVVKTVGKTIAAVVASATTTDAIKTVVKVIGVALSSSVTVTKAVSKTVALSSAGAVSALKAVAKTLAVAGTSATDLTAVKSVLKTISVSASSAVTLTKSVGKTIAATGSSAVTMAKAMAKTIAVAAGKSVTFVKQVAKTIAATGSGAVAVSAIKSILRTISVSASGAVAVTKSVGKTVAAVGTGAVSAVKSVGKRVSVVGTSAVSALKSVGKRIAATGAGAVSLSAVKAAFVTISVAASGAVAVRKAMTKSVAVSATGAVIAVKSITKSLSATCSSLVSVLFDNAVPGFIEYIARTVRAAARPRGARRGASERADRTPARPRGARRPAEPRG